MIAGLFTARSVFAGCVLGLIAVSALGGFLMAAVEGITYTKGLGIATSPSPRSQAVP
jgi:hypothetical protein